MDYSEAVALRDALETALLTNVGVSSVTYDGKTVTYQSTNQARTQLAQLNRDIAAYNRRASNINPSVSRPRWR